MIYFNIISQYNIAATKHEVIIYANSLHKKVYTCFIYLKSVTVIALYPKSLRKLTWMQILWKKSIVNTMLNLHNEERIHQVPWMNLCVGGLPLPQCRIEVTTMQDSLGRRLIRCHDLKKVCQDLKSVFQHNEEGFWYWLYIYIYIYIYMIIQLCK